VRPALPTHPVEFRVYAPELADGNAVRLLILGPADFTTIETMEMSREGDAWTAIADLPTNALVHYVYGPLR
jgi:hypothetical protein